MDHTQIVKGRWYSYKTGGRQGEGKALDVYKKKRGWWVALATQVLPYKILTIRPSQVVGLVGKKPTCEEFKASDRIRPRRVGRVTGLAKPSK